MKSKDWQVAGGQLCLVRPVLAVRTRRRLRPLARPRRLHRRKLGKVPDLPKRRHLRRHVAGASQGQQGSRREVRHGIQVRRPDFLKLLREVATFAFKDHSYLKIEQVNVFRSC